MAHSDRFCAYFDAAATIMNAVDAVTVDKSASRSSFDAMMSRLAPLVHVDALPDRQLLVTCGVLISKTLFRGGNYTWKNSYDEFLAELADGKHSNPHPGDFIPVCDRLSFVAWCALDFMKLGLSWTNEYKAEAAAELLRLCPDFSIPKDQIEKE